MSPASFTRVGRVRRALTLSASGIVAVSLVFVAMRHGLGQRPPDALARAFHLNGEFGVPAFFSTGLFLLSAWRLRTVARVQQARGQPARLWRVLAPVFVLLAFDELLGFHERLIGPVRRGLHTSGPFYFAWVIPYGAACLAGAAASLTTWWRLDPAPRRAVACAAVLFVTGALGMEMIGSAYYERVGRQMTLGYELLITVEETCEMAGLLLLLSALDMLCHSAHQPTRQAVLVPHAGHDQLPDA